MPVDTNTATISRTHSSTGNKRRQSANLTDKEKLFSQVLHQIVTTKKPVRDAGDVGEWQSTLDELNAAALANSIDAMLAALTTNPRFNRIYTTIPTVDPDQDAASEQEEPLNDKCFTRDDATGKRLIRLYSIEDIYQTPDAEYLISRILEAASVSLLYGLSGTGKTFTALHTGLCVAHGIPWHNRRVKPGVVWYINTEGARGLKKRLQAWYIEHPELSPTANFRVIPWPLDLREHISDLLNTVEQQVVKPELIIIDNFSMCTPGINQNLQEEVAPVLRTLNTLAQEHSCHVMIVHHTNKAGDANGTMAFRNHVDTMIELRKEDRADKDSAILFTCQKARDDEPFRDIKTELKTVSIGTHPDTYEDITSCIVVESQEPIKQEGLKDTPQAVLDILGDDILDYTAWKKAVMEALHISEATFNRAKTELIAKKFVEKAKVDGQRHDHYRKVSPVEQEEPTIAGSEGNDA